MELIPTQYHREFQKTVIRLLRVQLRQSPSSSVGDSYLQLRERLAWREALKHVVSMVFPLNLLEVLREERRVKWNACEDAGLFETNAFARRLREGGGRVVACLS